MQNIPSLQQGLALFLPDHTKMGGWDIGTRNTSQGQIQLPNKCCKAASKQKTFPVPCTFISGPTLPGKPPLPDLLICRQIHAYGHESATSQNYRSFRSVGPIIVLLLINEPRIAAHEKKKEPIQNSCATRKHAHTQHSGNVTNLSAFFTEDAQ